MHGLGRVSLVGSIEIQGVASRDWIDLPENLVDFAKSDFNPEFLDFVLRNTCFHSRLAVQASSAMARF